MSLAATLASTIAPKFLGKVGDLVKKYIPDTEKALAFQRDIQLAAVELEREIVKAQKDVIVAEAQGESWLQRNWRPILMLTIVAIVANNYIFAPYIELLFNKDITLPLPAELWALMKLGVGGYIVGRSGEKIVREYKNG